MADDEISPGNAHSLSRLSPPHLQFNLPYRFWTLKILAFSSGWCASYAIPVRQGSVLPSASFRFGVTPDTLAVRLTIPPVGLVEDFHLQVNAPCRAHQKETGLPIGSPVGPSQLIDLCGFLQFPEISISKLLEPHLSKPVHLDIFFRNDS
jgi:hypothetical protein